jgi:hypothetical protein
MDFKDATMYPYDQLEDDIRRILNRPVKEEYTYDILDTPHTLQSKKNSLLAKQRQMKVGDIWQCALGHVPGCINLKQGHETGLDILSHEREFIVELKNRTNTDNASSRKTNLDKLAKFKHAHPTYTCIYATINSSTKKKTMNTSKKIIIHNEVELEHHVGYEFLKFMCGTETDTLIEFIKAKMDQYEAL